MDEAEVDLRCPSAPMARLIELADPTVPFAIRAVCDLRVADQLRDGPRAVAELAAVTGTHEESLYRVLRALAGKGIFTEVTPGSFGLTPMADLLRSDHPLSLVEAYPLIAADLQAWAQFDHTLRTGRSAFEYAHGTGYYDYLADHGPVSAQVDRSVRAQNRHVLRTVLHTYPWARLATVVDVGGGDGTFLAGLLRRYPTMRGTLVDLPHVVTAAGEVLSAAGVADRADVVAGDFFDELPAGADGYILKTILHDWADVPAFRLLGRIRRAMREDSRLLVLEALLPGPDEFHIGKLLDLHSLCLVAGPDRDRQAMDNLMAAAGLRVLQTRTTATLGVYEIERIR